MQVTYDKLETKNLFSPHFGACRNSETFENNLLGQDPTLMIGQDAAKYKVHQPPCNSSACPLSHHMPRR